MNAKKEIIARLQAMAGSYTAQTIFSDWVKLSSIAVQNACQMVHGKDWQDREQRYKETAAKYSQKDLSSFAEMFVLLGDALEEDLSDVLGSVYMECGMGSKHTGQFFTPYHLSELTARLAVDIKKAAADDGMITLNEPSCGGGGMIIATCKILRDAKINYQRRLNVIAQDLDWNGVYMTYLQLSLIGCKAVVVQGDTLREPYAKHYPSERIMRTPAMMGIQI